MSRISTLTASDQNRQALDLRSTRTAFSECRPIDGAAVARATRDREMPFQSLCMNDVLAFFGVAHAGYLLAGSRLAEGRAR